MVFFYTLFLVHEKYCCSPIISHIQESLNLQFEVWYDRMAIQFMIRDSTFRLHLIPGDEILQKYFTLCDELSNLKMLWRSQVPIQISTRWYKYIQEYWNTHKMINYAQEMIQLRRRWWNYNFESTSITFERKFIYIWIWLLSHKKFVLYFINLHFWFKLTNH